MKRLLTLVVLLLGLRTHAQNVEWFVYAFGACGNGDCFYISLNSSSLPTKGQTGDVLLLTSAGSNVYLLSDPLANGGYANFDIGEAQGTLSLVSGGPTGSYYTASGANWWIFAPNLPFLGTNCTFYGVGPNYTGNWNWTAQNPVWSSVTVVGGGSQNFFNLSGSGSWIVWSKGNGCVGTEVPNTTMGWYASNAQYPLGTTWGRTWASVDFAASQFPYNGPGYSFVVGPADYNDQIKLTITQTVGGCSGMTLGPYASSAHAILNATTDNISLAYVESSGISGTVSIHPTAWATGTVTTPVDTATTGYSVANYNHCFSAAGYSCPSSVSFYPNTTGQSVTRNSGSLGADVQFSRTGTLGPCTNVSTQQPVFFSATESWQ